MEAAMINGAPKHHGVEEMVHALAERRRRDIDVLRGYLRASGHDASSNRDASHLTPSVGWAGRGANSSLQSGRVRRSGGDRREGNRKDETGSILLTCMRTCFLDIPLFVLVSLLVTIFCIKVLLKDYYTPLLQASSRTLDDSNLEREFTYYERFCTEKDVTTHDLSSLLLTNDTTTDAAVDQMMYHGGALIPQVLDPETVIKMREFIVRRTGELSSSEAYPMSQGYKRVSFGIDATEDPIVPVALRQVATNPILKPLLEELLGEDPAVTEITAITSYAGCDEQVWHPDVKPDGNALKFARTYSHSFSFFVALQDITAEMGSTELCPGTHYCANDLEDVCDRHGIQLNEAAQDRLWHSGDGALLNQQVWHRGAKHSGFDSPERILFIVSFIGRPRLGIDPRQLSRGTYFHMKWNMWGHTFQDLEDAHRSMAKPFSVLRCLSVWKPPNRHWGYDLITSAVMRIANIQNGMEPEEVETFVHEVIEGKLGIPKFLQGTVDTEDLHAWKRFLMETVELVLAFLTKVNAVAFGVYGLFALLFCIEKKSLRPFRRSVVRVMVLIVLAFSIGHMSLKRIEKSDWGQNISTGRTLRAPYSPNQDVEDDTITTGPTTLPEQNDVLVGSRYDAPFMNAYNTWLDYHPGNLLFKNSINDLKRLPKAAWSQAIDWILYRSGGIGRVLQQDWRSGEWRVMTTSEATDVAEKALVKSLNGLIATMDKAVAVMLSDYRFGEHRDTSLALKSQSRLMDLRNILFSGGVLSKRFEPTPMSISRSMALHSMATVSSLVEYKVDFSMAKRTHAIPPLQEPEGWEEGDRVLVDYDGQGTFYGGAVTKVLGDSLYKILYDDGTSQMSVSWDSIRRMVPLEEGAPVLLDSDSGAATVPARVRRVKPSGAIDATLYKDGQVIEHVPSGFFARQNL